MIFILSILVLSNIIFIVLYGLLKNKLNTANIELVHVNTENKLLKESI